MELKVIRLSKGFYKVNGEIIRAETPSDAIQTYLNSHCSGGKIYT